MSSDHGDEQACLGDLNLLDEHPIGERQQRVSFHAKPRVKKNKGNGYLLIEESIYEDSQQYKQASGFTKSGQEPSYLAEPGGSQIPPVSFAGSSRDF